MGKQSRKKRVLAISGTAKGRIVEQIAAWMYSDPGIIVETNVHLQVPGGNRKREIDVLLTYSIAGCPVRVPIECKNERKIIGVEKIDAFIGKLQDLQLPLEQSIFISASGYTSDALERARAVGMQALTLKGLTKAGLIESTRQALEATVYLLLQVVRWPRIDIPCYERNPFCMFCDQQGYPVGSLLDLVVEQWKQGSPLSRLGGYDLEVRIPPGWYHLIQETLCYTPSMSIHVHVHGLVTTSKGHAGEYELINGWNGKNEKCQVHIALEPNPPVMQVTSITEESQLQEIIHASSAPAILTHRLRLPRILLAALCFWPLSMRVAEKLLTNLLAREQGTPLPHAVGLKALEGTDMRTVFDPIWEGQRLNVDVEQIDAFLAREQERIRQSLQKGKINIVSSQISSVEHIEP